jgi:crotonobetaine/carnitine-CoA ligase
LVVRDGFDSMQFWSDVRAFDCQMGLAINVASLLWDQPRRLEDSDNPLKVLAVTPLIREYRDFEERFDVRVTSIYGMTEIGPALTSGRPSNHRVSGTPTPGYRCRLVDADGQDVAPGAVGELMVRHDRANHLMTEYDGLPNATHEARRTGWFRTGDRFADNGGELCFVDRAKDSIRHHGQNVSSFEVEDEVRSHPAVLECACVGHPVPAAGEAEVADEDIRLFVVLHEGCTIDPDDLYLYMVERLARFMIPRYIEIIGVMPLNASGRTLKPELRSRPISPGTWDRRAAYPDPRRLALKLPSR